MKKLEEKKVFIIDNESLKVLMQDDKIRYYLNCANMKKRKYIHVYISKLNNRIKKLYKCKQVKFNTEILEHVILEKSYRTIINLPIYCKCCGEFTFKKDMHNNDICEGCYQDANAIPRCCRCGGYVDLECNCD